MAVTDIRINSMVRAVIARNWIDLQRLRYGSFRGTVRISGTLCYLGARASQNFDPGKLEVLESEIRRIPGAKRIYFDLRNWRKNTQGQWECLDRGAQAATAKEVFLDEPVPAISDLEIDGNTDVGTT